MRVVHVSTYLVVDDDAHFNSDHETQKHLKRNDVHEGISVITHYHGKFDSLAEWAERTEPVKLQQQ